MPLSFQFLCWDLRILTSVKNRGLYLEITTGSKINVNYTSALLTGQKRKVGLKK